MLVSNVSGHGVSNQAPLQEKLSERINSKTNAIHKRVEKSQFVELLLAGQLEPKKYHQYLTDLLVIYRALEKNIELSLKTTPELKSIYFPELCRERSLEADLTSFDFNKLIAAPSKAALAYVEHLDKLDHQDPLMLAAHAYVRYLGDLAGGRIIKDHIKKIWPQATEFYNFSKLLEKHDKKSAWSFKEFLKGKFDQLQLTNTERDTFIAEAIKAFEYAEEVLNAALVSNNLKIEDLD